MRREELVAAREAAGLSQEALAEAVGVYTSTVARWERGEVAPRAGLRADLAAALGVDLPALADLITPPTPATSAASWSAVLATAAPAERAPILAPLMAALMDYRATTHEPLDADALAAAVLAARADYQATRYAALSERLPVLLLRLPMATAVSGGRTSALAAAALMTAAGFALKVGNTSAATIAADRAMLAAAASGLPAAMGASARSVVHALMRTGQHAAAADLAMAQARLLAGDRDAHTEAVRGALLLRGAVAAAGAMDRDRSADLVAEADAIAARVPATVDGGAGFSSANVALHRVNLAVSLGDAGTALAVARTIDVDTIPLVERRAALAIDVARAYTQWGRYEAALDALHLAMRIAPEEVRTRRAVASMVDTLGRAGPPSLRPHVRAYAARMAAAT
ncbi:MAG: helix-turn-helix transcriptional regulator [Glycomyces artemisiae]|uniref:Helix-turn-helix transcriptional regulator n=1 Tax=Glycomyces artemisiae TaxID=1076443 RepID=A0A850C4I6_9ACTN|nr:helix-turn-helix transcriptional regulator [Glycomyces artemisiae]